MRLSRRRGPESLFLSAVDVRSPGGIATPPRPALGALLPGETREPADDGPERVGAPKGDRALDGDAGADPLGEDGAPAVPGVDLHGEAAGERRAREHRHAMGIDPLGDERE